MNNQHIMRLFILYILFISTISQYAYTRTTRTHTNTINSEPYIHLPENSNNFISKLDTPPSLPHQTITITAYILDYLLDIKHYMTTLIITNPMKNLYLNGPKSLFCWGGDELYDICARITGSSSEFWNKNMPECITIIEKQFKSYYIMLTTILYVILVYKVVTIIWWRLFIMRPMMNHVDTILEPLLLTLANK